MDEITKLANAAELLGALAEEHGVDIDSMTEEQLQELLGYAVEAIGEDATGGQALDEVTQKAAELVNEKLASAGYTVDDLTEEQAEYLLAHAYDEVEKTAGLYGGDEDHFYHMGAVFAQGFNDQLNKQARLEEDIEKIALSMQGIKNMPAKLQDFLAGLKGAKHVAKRETALGKAQARKLKASGEPIPPGLRTQKRRYVEMGDVERSAKARGQALLAAAGLGGLAIPGAAVGGYYAGKK